MDIPTLKVSSREQTGRRNCNALRREGLIPAILYGRGKPNVMLSFEEKALQDLINAHALVFNLEADEEKTPVQLLEVQYDSFGDEILHADLGRISMSETIEVSVAVETKGDPIGVREEGGVLEVIRHEVSIETLPGNIPEQITLDVAELTIGDDIRVGDLPLPEGVTSTEDDDAVVVTCVPPMEMVTEEDEEMAEEEVMAEPELIRREEEEEVEPGEEESAEEAEGGEE